MMDKKSYHDLKAQIKCLCKTDAIRLADDMQLDDYDRKLLMCFVENKTRIKMCDELCMSTVKCTTDMKALFTKIYNYKNTR